MAVAEKVVHDDRIVKIILCPDINTSKTIKKRQHFFS